MSLSFLANQLDFDAIEEYGEAVCLTIFATSFFVNWEINDSPGVPRLDTLEIDDGLTDYEERKYGDVTLNQFEYDVTVGVCIDDTLKIGCMCPVEPFCFCPSFQCDTEIPDINVHLRESVAYLDDDKDGRTTTTTTRRPASPARNVASWAKKTPTGSCSRTPRSTLSPQ